MIFRLSLLLLLSMPSLVSFSQPDFDMATFNEKAATAEWLSFYDKLAWHSTDLVQEVGTEEDFKQLGAEWFCFQDEKETWHITYGNFKEDKYTTVFHFILNQETSKIERISEDIDASISTPICRALNQAYSSLETKLEKDEVQPIRMNHYVKIEENKNVTIYIFPAFQPDGTAAYGGEFIYHFDQEGKKLLDKTEYVQEFFRGFEANGEKSIELDYKDLDFPSIGGVFFCVYYAPYFKSIYLRTNKGLHSLVLNKDGGGSWMHAPLPDEKETQEEKKPSPTPKKSKKKKKN